MKNYNFNKAKQLIAENLENLESASLGMHEDWFWTAETVWENGEYKNELNDETTISGIGGSSWATPTLQLLFKDGSEKMIECSEGETDNHLLNPASCKIVVSSSFSIPTIQSFLEFEKEQEKIMRGNIEMYDIKGHHKYFTFAELFNWYVSQF